MFKRMTAAGLAALAAATLAVAPSAGAVTPGGRADRATRTCGAASRDIRAIEVVGLTADQRLVCFRAGRPDRARDIGDVAGLDVDTRLVGIDARPANGAYYGLGDQGGVYTVDVSTAQATLVSRLTVPLDGTSFGVDFNPAADRLRVVSDTGQNLRINVDTGATTADTGLSYTPGTPATGIVAAAYTNNDLAAATATTLFDVDSALDQVAVQSPPNNGTLAPTGKLGVDAGPDTSADIYTRTRDEAARDNTGFAAVNGPDGSTFHLVDVLTGSVRKVGTFSGKNTVIGIAVP
ncbi:MAG TPA: DUF4394 domain-containing protein, partial [Acidimicrobiales bacterium]|nr:DUF4394 domain-containing protein [Acidimicrobiales bacterium]